MKGNKMIDPLADDFPESLLKDYEPPCISLYQPTHRFSPENQQDPIRFRNLLKMIEEMLQQKYPKHETDTLMQPFQALVDNDEFWNHTLDGLAVLGARDIFKVYRLQRPVIELAVVSESFHIKPLMRILQSADRYQILALGREHIKLYEGNRYSLDEVELAKGVPRTIDDALGKELTEPYENVVSYGKGSTGPAMYYGQGAKMDELDIDTERFFHIVDQTILEHHSRPSHLPLMLAALTEYHTLFRNISKNPYLMSKGLDTNPDALTIDELRKRAWEIVEPDYLTRINGLIGDFGAAKPKGLATDDLAQIAKAAVEGRIATLLIDAERQVPGQIEAATGEIEFAKAGQSDIDDLLDDLGELAIKKGSQIMVVPTDKMPTQTGAAAIYRY